MSAENNIVPYTRKQLVQVQFSPYKYKIVPRYHGLFAKVFTKVISMTAMYCKIYHEDITMLLVRALQYDLNCFIAHTCAQCDIETPKFIKNSMRSYQEKNISGLYHRVHREILNNIEDIKRIDMSYNQVKQIEQEVVVNTNLSLSDQKKSFQSVATKAIPIGFDGNSYTTQLENLLVVDKENNTKKYLDPYCRITANSLTYKYHIYISTDKPYKDTDHYFTYNHHFEGYYGIQGFGHSTEEFYGIKFSDPQYLPQTWQSKKEAGSFFLEKGTDKYKIDHNKPFITYKTGWFYGEQGIEKFYNQKTYVTQYIETHPKEINQHVADKILFPQIQYELSHPDLQEISYLTEKIRNYIDKPDSSEKQLQYFINHREQIIEYLQKEHLSEIREHYKDTIVETEALRWIHKHINDCDNVTLSQSLITEENFGKMLMGDVHTVTEEIS